MIARSTCRWIAPCLAIALVAVACGDDDDDDGATSAPPAAATPASDAVAPADSGPAGTTGSDATAPSDTDAPAGTAGAPADDRPLDPDATLRFGWTVPATPLDPHTPTSIVAQYPYVAPLYDRLTNLVAGPTLEPMLATEWTAADDGLSMTFTLRDDVTFHDGTPVDAAAVKASLERAMNLPESTVARYFGMVTGIEVVDPLTVRIDTNRPASDLPYVLATSAGSIINPLALDDPDLGTTPNGSGPYVLTGLSLGDRATYEPAADYWDPDAQKVAEIEIIGITDDNARINALRAGEIDGMLSKLGLYDQVSELGDGFDFFSYPSSSIYSLYINQTSPELSDVRVRQALNYAVDREALNDTILYGQCPPVSQPLTDTYSAGYVADLADRYTYDPDEARRLLAEAGAEGLQLDVLFGNGLSPQQDMVQVLQAMFADIGVTLTPSPFDAATQTGEWVTGNHDLYMQVRTGSPTANDYLARSYTIPPGWIGDPVPEFKDLVDPTFDPTMAESEVDADLQEASTIAVEQAFDVFICSVPTQIAYADYVVGADSMGQSDFQGIFDLRYVGIAEH